MANNDPAYRLITAEKRERAIQLRLKGLRWDQVAAEVGYAGGGAARSSIMDLLDDRLEDLGKQAHEYRMIELARLDALLRAHWDAAVSGDDLKAAEYVLKIINQRIRLTGADQPIKVDLTGGVVHEVVGWTPPGYIPPAESQPEVEE